MSGGFTVPPWPRFQRPPYDPGRSVFPSPVLTLAFPLWACPRRSGSSADSHTPQHARGLPKGSPLCSARATTRPCVRTRHAIEAARRPEPLRPDPVLPRPGRRPAPPREGLAPFVARTGSCARPHLSRRPRSSLRLRVFAGCGQPLLRCGPSQRYSVLPSLRAWTPTPAASRVHLPASSPGASAFPAIRSGSALRNSRRATSRRKHHFGAAVIPLCSGPQACSPPRSLPPRRLPRRVAVAFPSGHLAICCLLAHRICSPSESGD